MGKVELYRQALREQADWDSYLLSGSGLPGPRANLELAQAAAEEGDEGRFRSWLALDAGLAPAGSPEEFLPFCGLLGYGRLLAGGRRDLIAEIRLHASDPRWRLREAAAMALQRWGAADMEALLDELEGWAHSSPLEQRAAAAALCEPALLGDARHTERVLGLLDEITAAIPAVQDRREPGFQALRKGLGYCWSVAVAAHPQAGKPLMEKWLAVPDRDIAWIMQENLKKNRLARMDPEWVAAWRK